MIMIMIIQLYINHVRKAAKWVILVRGQPPGLCFLCIVSIALHPYTLPGRCVHDNTHLEAHIRQGRTVESEHGLETGPSLGNAGFCPVSDNESL